MVRVQTHRSTLDSYADPYLEYGIHTSFDRVNLSIKPMEWLPDVWGATTGEASVQARCAYCSKVHSPIALPIASRLLQLTSLAVYPVTIQSTASYSKALVERRYSTIPALYA